MSHTLPNFKILFRNPGSSLTQNIHPCLAQKLSPPRPFVFWTQNDRHLLNFAAIKNPNYIFHQKIISVGVYFTSFCSQMNHFWTSLSSQFLQTLEYFITFEAVLMPFIQLFDIPYSLISFSVPSIPRAVLAPVQRCL